MKEYVMQETREKVIKGLEHCLTLDSPCGGCPYYSYEDIQELNCERGLRRDVIALLKEQEHKDKMYHALEDDWKRLKALLKEQQQQIWELQDQVEYLTDKLKEQEAVVHPESSCEMKYITDCCCNLCGVQLIREDNFCRGCGKPIDWSK